MKVSKNVIVVSVLVLLLVISVIQAIQLRDIKSNMDDIGVSGSSLKGKISTSTSTPQPSGSGGVPTNIQNLPGMVGGC